MHIAVEGCCHGELDKIYETMQYMERRDKIKIELLLCCGDFQSVRDEADLTCMACPDKYKSMQTFWQYYNGIKKAPYLTIFIGGNHEASNHLQELPYGGWVAPNIFFMGYSNVVTYKGLRIGGISGIFKYHDFNKGHFEKPPYDNTTKRSVYHIRSVEIFRMKLLNTPLDIMMSHDWPNGVVDYGNVSELLRHKPFFEEDIRRNRLGSSPAMELLRHMKPTHWFSGHMHVKFSAVIPHNGPGNNNKVTNFLALDKCLPRRQFLQVIDMKVPENCENQGLCYDPEWLAILKSTNDLVSVSRRNVYIPQSSDDSMFVKHVVTSEKVDKMKNIFNNDFIIPNNFKRDISPLYDPRRHNRHKPILCKTSHQTTEFCAKLEINDPLMMAIAAEGGDLSLSFNSSSVLYDEDEEMPSTIVSSTSINEDEIDLGSDDDADGDVNKNEIETTNKTNTELSISILSDKKKVNNGIKMDETEPESPLVLSSLSSDDDSGNKTSSGSETNRGVMRLSLSLPAPVFGATSTPVRQSHGSKIDHIEPELSDTPIGNLSPANISVDSDSCNSLSNEKLTPISFPKPLKPETSLAKNALLMSLKGKRLSDDIDSDMSESSSGNTPSGTKKFKRRNASFYSSQSEDSGDNTT
uniref:lariat debranching enzyme B-like n=1 Tax=Styela clava TaxID=7725 RepID=UPI00193A395C|nr:lariat debranching enzyme B-like [Styela clava]